MLAAVGPFDLDPCSPVDRPWPMADRHYTITDDGMSLPWDGLVWCNPPFGPDAERWLTRCAEHGNAVALVPARTETRWFVKTIWNVADGVLFLHGRPHFHHVDGRRGAANSGAPICLVAYGASALSRLQTCGLPGSLVTKWG
jgi:hypothetical protein